MLFQVKSSQEKERVSEKNQDEIQAPQSVSSVKPSVQPAHSVKYVTVQQASCFSTNPNVPKTTVS